jgi:hypothetical protein
MLGPTIYQGDIMRDDSGSEGLFFITDGLAIRKTGLFRLRFDLYSATLYFGIEFSDQEDKISCRVWSDVFEALPPQSFTGVKRTILV